MTQDNNEYVDVYGARYSSDGKTLLRVPEDFIGEYTVREGTEIIGTDAFDRCSKLTGVVFPDSVTTLGYMLFLYCFSLETVEIPPNVKDLDENPFTNWDGEVINRSPYLVYEDEVLFNKDKTKLISFRKETDRYAIPDSVKIIGKKAFHSRDYLKEVVIPQSVTTTREWTLRWCVHLDSAAATHLTTTAKQKSYADSGIQLLILKAHKSSPLSLKSLRTLRTLRTLSWVEAAAGGGRGKSEGRAGDSFLSPARPCASSRR